MEPRTLSCFVCQQPNPAGTRYCAGCGTQLPDTENSKDISPLAEPEPAEETVLGHRTLLGTPALDSEETLLEPPPAIPGGEHTLLGMPRPLLPTERPAWEGPTVLDGAFTGQRDDAQDPAFTPIGGHPALPASAGAEVIDLDEDPDRPLPAVTPLARPRVRGRGATVRRPPRWRQLALLLGTALLAALGTVVALSWVDDGFRAELVGDLAVTRTSSGYQVQVGARTSGPASVMHPGGRDLVDGEAALRFEVEDARIKLGDNPVVLQVSPGQGRARTLTLHVMAYYKLVPEGPAVGGALQARLEVLPGWRMHLETPGEVAVRQPGVFALRLPPTGPVVPVRFSLESPDGARFTFDESLRTGRLDAAR